MRREFTLPAENEKAQGKIMADLLTPEMMLLLIDIHSRRIPELFPDQQHRGNGKCLYINYCIQGRCELKLKNGEVTYLEGGELAVDTGQAYHENSTFYYPTAEYEGVELFFCINEALEDRLRIGTGHFTEPKELYEKCSVQERPCIIVPSDFLKERIKSLKQEEGKALPDKARLLGAAEILILLNGLSFEKEVRRIYYTPSQVQIAKSVMETITADLSKRYSTAEFAKRFGVSETSIKNYFKGVYGCGYSEFQTKLRMEQAACLLKTTRRKVSEIAAIVGFSNQSKFAKIFGDCFGVSPLEYRRRENLKDGKQPEKIHG